MFGCAATQPTVLLAALTVLKAVRRPGGMPSPTHALPRDHSSDAVDDLIAGYQGYLRNS
jgi:hypothetical protein